jgi:hypothetical protein
MPNLSENPEDLRSSPGDQLAVINCSWVIAESLMRMPTAIANPLSVESKTHHGESRTLRHAMR